MTELAVRNIHTGSDLAISGDQTTFTDRQVAVLRQIGLEEAKQGDLDVFFHQCQRTGLDPFAKQIYMIGRNSQNQKTKQWEVKYTIQTGIDGYRLVARRAADRARETLGYRDTLWCGADGRWTDVWLSDEPPAAAKVIVVRQGQDFPAIALWREYVQTVKDGSPNSMWQRMGAGQLAKCAEALALRKAYPQDLSGLYTQEEMGQSENSHPRTPTEKPINIRDAIAAEPNIRTEAQSKKLFALMREVGLDDREQALHYFADKIGRPLSSTKELTKDEASTLIEDLTAMSADGIQAATGEVIEAELVDDETPRP